MLDTTGTLHKVDIGEFITEAGATIPDVTIAYQAWGTFHGNNLIVVEHALTGDSNVVDWWDGVVGPGKALDTDKYCVLCTNALGGCMGSTGPTSLAPDGNHWGSRFPALSIRDLVAAEKQFLDKVGVTQILAVLGGSMGGSRT